MTNDKPTPDTTQTDKGWREELIDKLTHKFYMEDIINLVSKVESEAYKRVARMVIETPDPYMVRATEKRFLKDLEQLTK